jgi:hypothetical protein
MSINSFKVRTSLVITPQAAAPSGPENGEIYYDTTLNIFRQYVNGAWKTIANASLTDAHILVGNGSGVATDVAVSGDLSLANTGAFTIANSAVTNGKIANGTIDLTTKVTGVLPAANVGLVRTINAQTGTTYTFALADGSAAGGNPLVTGSNASAQTYTVPPNSSVAFPVGTQIDIIQIGAGKITLAQGSGVTINSKDGNKAIGAQYVGVTLVKLATDTWNLTGDLIA